jgi:hypothetical protein
MVVRRAGRFDELAPAQGTVPPQASTLLLQTLVQSMVALNQKVDALARTRQMPLVVEDDPRAQRAEDGPEKASGHVRLTGADAWVAVAKPY